VREILAENLNISRHELTPTAHLFEDLGMDSMKAIEVVMAIEEEFGIEIPDADAEKWKTVPELLQYVEEKLQHAGRTDR
jgi:acyl carrier protein